MKGIFIGLVILLTFLVFISIVSGIIQMHVGILDYIILTGWGFIIGMVSAVTLAAYFGYKESKDE